MSSLSKSLPWTRSPLICNAPMGGFANHELACAVTKAGGLGLVGSTPDMSALDSELNKAREILSPTSTKIHRDKDVLPLGVGFLVFITKLDEAREIVAKHRPAVVWFFAAKHIDEYTTWTTEMRKASPNTQIWIQNGSVTSALSIAQSCKPDALVMQGNDAGGHGYEKSASVISLVPETIDTLSSHGISTPLIAAGGIVEGRGIVAALALGAQGVVMGTRFLAASETIVPHAGYRSALVSAKDGGQVTVRDKVFDMLNGPNIWPVEYDGRSIVSRSYEDFKAGVGLDAVRKELGKVEKESSKGFGEDGEKRATVWCGTGVGLVVEVQGAGEIIEEVSKKARSVLRGLM